MRKAFDPQLRLDGCPVLQVQLNLNCRDEIIPILHALQHIYSQPKLRDEILDRIAQDVNGKSSSRFGREGLGYWEILVLAAVRLGCNLDYDKLQDLAENHRALRHIMGIGDWDEKKTFDWRRIQDNLCKTRPQTIERINHLIVAEGHRLEPEAAETVRADSFVVETNIHYPTEGSLIRDGLRKILQSCAALAKRLNHDGWRQRKHLYRKAKKLSRNIDRIASRKGRDSKQRLKVAYQALLDFSGDLVSRAYDLQEVAAKQARGDLEILALNQELKVFLQRTEQVRSTACRRVLEGEQVPNNEKLFSIFETHTQLYKRGKAGQPVQFGRLAMVYEDAAGFICHYYVLLREAQDRDVAVEQTRIVQNRLQGRIRQASFDRGFHSPDNQKELAQIIAHPCLPMPGKKGQRQARQASVEFRQARQRHSGIESVIGALQSGNGLARSRDRTEPGFERYLGLGVLGRNLHVLGKLLIARQQASCQAALSRRGQSAA